MARDFDGVDDYITVSFPQETGKLSIALVYKHDTAPGSGFPNRQFALWRGDSNSTEANYYVFFLDTAVRLGWTNVNSTFNEASGAFTADTSEHTLVISADWDGDAFTMYVDGASLTVTTATGSLTTTPQTTGTVQAFGGRTSSGVPNTEPFNGKISQVGIWQGVALSAADAAAYNKTRNPSMVRPDGLTRYWPFIRELQELVGGTAITNSGPVVADHPRIYLPRRRGIIGVPAAGAPSSDVLMQGLHPIIAGLAGLSRGLSGIEHGIA